jgi:hypothetical protein|tara:strand:- start:298 stop:495 length:198 start_codon:yes stop_codon:yes gene_type:complete
MTIKTQIHISDFLEDADNAAGESSMNGNLYFEVQFATPTEKQQVREILTRHYKEIRAELKTVDIN